MLDKAHASRSIAQIPAAQAQKTRILWNSLLAHCTDWFDATRTWMTRRRLGNQTRGEGKECARDGTVDETFNVTRSPYRSLPLASTIRNTTD